MKTIELTYKGPLSEGMVKVVGGRFIAFKRDEPVELPAENAEALLRQDPKAWQKPAKSRKEESGANKEE